MNLQFLTSIKYYSKYFILGNVDILAQDYRGDNLRDSKTKLYRSKD